MKEHDIFTDLLRLLHVPHTQQYSAQRFATMSFKTMFGLKGLLSEYGVDSEGLQLADKSQVAALPVPFIASCSKGLIIVEQLQGENDVKYMSQGVELTMPYSEFIDAWDGIAFLASPRPEAVEPDYRKHLMVEWVARLRNVALLVCAAFIFCYLFISNGIYGSWSLILLMLLNVMGLTFSVMLEQKTLNIHTKAAEHVCGVLQAGGCDEVLANKASTFLGIFHWSEVGFTYFSVSLLTILIFPQFAGYLAAINICCLPYTLWSIWYQKFRAKAWCTLCVSVQATLWLLFIVYLTGGWVARIFPLSIEFFVLIATYGLVFTILNIIFPRFKRED